MAIERNFTAYDGEKLYAIIDIDDGSITLGHKGHEIGIETREFNAIIRFYRSRMAKEL